MAADKRKILANAQKYLQKGQLDKAVKEYQRLVEVDPHDANHRLKLGDILLRQGKRDEAVDCYLKVGKKFMKDGFDAKAVAIYKQIVKIDEKRFEVYEPLAELYERLGLTAEALSALQTAADHHNREGRKREALELLRKMATLDPTNTTSRLKVADLLRQAEMASEALAEYEEVAAELQRQGATDDLVGVFERILELDPDRFDVLVALGRGLMELRQPQRAEPFARKAVENGPDATEGHELLAEVLAGMGREDAAKEVYRTLAELYRNRGERDRAREIMQRFVAPGDLAAGGPALDLGGAGEELGAPQPEQEPPVLEQDEPELPADAAAEAPSLQGEEAISTDPEQLLAEASVYLRYGKASRAIATLQTILETDPDHRGALEKLGEVKAENDDAAGAVAAWTRAMRVAEAGDDAEGVAVLRGRISALDPAAAGGDAPASASESLDAVDLEIDLGDDLETEEAPPETDAPPLETDAPPLETDAPPLETQAPAPAADEAPAPELDLAAEPESAPVAESEIVVLDDAPTPPAPTTDAGESAGGVEIDVDLDMDVDLDVDAGAEAVASEAPTPTAAPEPAEATSSAGSSSTHQQIAEDLDEADFYFNQGLMDEAESIYRRILEVAPSHPQAMLRLGEIAEARGEDPNASTGGSSGGGDGASAAAAEQTEEPGISIDEDLENWDEVGDEEGVAAEAATGDTGAGELDVDLDLDLDEPDAAAGTADDGESTAVQTSAPAEVAPTPRPEITIPEDLAGILDDDAPAEEAEEGAPEDDTTAPGSGADAPAPAAAAAPRLPNEPEAGEDTFDLAAELSDVFEPEDDAAAGAEVDDGFESVFAEFKKGVKETLSESDYEAHYDLGIAYREMGLLEDANSEFGIAMGSPERKVACLHMLGLCALDLGRPNDAVAHLQQALAEPGVPEEQQAVLRFELGRGFQAAGDRERALSAFEAVAAVDPEFQDVEARIRALRTGGGAEITQPDEPALETFESFDDVIAEAEAVLSDDDEAEVSAEPEEEEAIAVAEPPSDDDTQSGISTPKKRRRKISFL